MKVPYEKSLKYKVLQRLETLPYTVILRSDLKDLAGNRQISEVLQQLIEDEKIVRLGYGVYAKLYYSKIANDSYIPGGFGGALREAFNRLHVKWRPSRAMEAYNSGKSTQVPANPVFRIDSRFTRKLSLGRLSLIKEA